MITKNPMQLKALIKNKASENQISAQLVMQNYMLERLLERISMSKYHDNFILKGGFLISAIVGLDTRATMDLDTTIKGITLTKEALNKIFEEICQISLDDDVIFAISGINDIRETDEYPGIRIGLNAQYLPLNVPLSVDVTTGDAITPKEIEYTFKLLFDDRKISILAYNLETILAEKIETVLSRSIANTRPRDFYDIYIIYKLRSKECNLKTLKDAIEKTTEKRGSLHVLSEYQNILNNIQDSDRLKGFWNRYQKDFIYANNIEFMDVCNCIKKIMQSILPEYSLIIDENSKTKM